MTMQGRWVYAVGMIGLVVQWLWAWQLIPAYSWLFLLTGIFFAINPKTLGMVAQCGLITWSLGGAAMVIGSWLVKVHHPALMSLPTLLMVPACVIACWLLCGHHHAWSVQLLLHLPAASLMLLGMGLIHHWLPSQMMSLPLLHHILMTLGMTVGDMLGLWLGGVLVASWKPTAGLTLWAPRRRLIR